MLFSQIPLYSSLASSYITEVNRIYLNDPNFIDISGRSIPNNRSFGLLESAGVSATFIAFGFFSIIYLINASSVRKYFQIGFFYLLILVCCMNFTSIFIFLIIYSIFSVLIFIYLDKAKVQRIQLWRISFKLLIIFIFLFTVLFLFLPNEKLLLLKKVFFYPYELIFSKDLHPKNHYPSMIIIEVHDFISAVESNPALIFFGDGFSTKYGHSKGSDLGFIESIYRFGLPFYIGVIFMILKGFLMLINKLKTGIDHKQFLKMQFSISCLLFIFLMDVHYSVYQSKSVLPILFFAIGLFPRSKRRKAK
jgi:hypothetical protein